MTQLPKVKDTFVNAKTAQSILKTRAGKQAAQVFSNAADRFLRGHQLALSGKTPFEVVYEREIISLRFYKADVETGENKHRVPLVIIPPLAANTLVFDLFPDRSLIRYFQSQGFDVYMIDWGTPSRKQAKYNFGTYIKIFMPDFISKIREHSGQQQLSLYGWSLGGAISLCYTSLFK